MLLTGSLVSVQEPSLKFGVTSCAVVRWHFKDLHPEATDTQEPREISLPLLKGEESEGGDFIFYADQII